MKQRYLLYILLLLQLSLNGQQALDSSALAFVIPEKISEASAISSKILPTEKTPLTIILTEYVKK